MLKKILSGALAAVLALSLFSGCGYVVPKEGGRPVFVGTGTSGSPSSDNSESSLTGEEIAIELRDGASHCAASGVEISGGSITIKAAGDYLLSGALSDGQIIVDAPEDAKVTLILNGVSIVKNGHAAIYARSADKLVLSTIADSENLLQSAGEFVQTDDSNVDAAVFARCDLTFSGSGVLNISSLTGHAVVSKDDIKFKGGTVNLEAAGKGLYGKDSISIEGGVLNADVGTDGICSSNSEDSGKGTIRIEGGSVNLLCQKDGLDAAGGIRIDGGYLLISAGSNREGMGLKSNADILLTGGNLSVTSVDDAIHASGSVKQSGSTLVLSTMDDGIHADNSLTISGGSLTIEQSYEGLEAQSITVSGGTTRVSARDDGFNAAGGNDGSNSMGFFGGDPFAADSDASLSITGGTIYVNADGDGLDSNGYLKMTGGSVYISGPTNSANGALDYGLDAVITGGTLVAVGAAGMAENFGRNSSQASMLVNFSSAQPAGSRVYLLDKTGGILVSYEPEKSFSSVVISVGGLTVGESYTLVAGSEDLSIALDSLIYGSGGTPGSFGAMPGAFGERPGGFGGMPGELPPEFGPQEGFNGTASQN